MISRRPKAVLWRSEVATMLAQKLVLPVKSSVNCDAARRRKRSIPIARRRYGGNLKTIARDR